MIKFQRNMEKLLMNSDNNSLFDISNQNSILSYKSMGADEQFIENSPSGYGDGAGSRASNASMAGSKASVNW